MECPTTGKTRYDSRRDATTASLNLNARCCRRGGVNRLEIYRCDRCGGWHTGRQRVSRIRRRDVLERVREREEQEELSRVA